MISAKQARNMQNTDKIGPELERLHLLVLKAIKTKESFITVAMPRTFHKDVNWNVIPNDYGTLLEDELNSLGYKVKWEGWIEEPHVGQEVPYLNLTISW